MVESNTCLIRITNVANTFVYDISELFSITRCDLPGDVTGDCKVDLYDLTVLAASWLNQE